MTLAQLLVVYDPREIANLAFAANGDILSVTFRPLPATAPALDTASEASAKKAEKPVKLRASSDASLVNPLPLHVLD